MWSGRLASADAEAKFSCHRRTHGKRFYARPTARSAKRGLTIVILSVWLSVRHDPVPNQAEIETSGSHHTIA